MADRDTSRDVRAKDAVDAIRSGLSNADVMRHFKISAQGFADLLRQLFERGLITQEDLSARGIRFRVVKKHIVATASQIPEPPPMEEPEDFLDTVELTELLSAKASADQAAKQSAAPPPASSEEEARKSELPAKKGRFPFAKLFKKER